MKITVNAQKAFLWFGIAVFIINSVFRNSIYALTGISLPGYFSGVNFIAIVALIYIAFRFGIKKTYENYLLLIVIFIYTVLTLISNLSATSSISQYVLFASILPGMLICLYNSEQINWDDMFKTLLKIMNIVFSVIFLIGILDYFLGGVVNNFLANYMSDTDWAAMIRKENEVYGFRMCSIIGSPLMNAFYALIMLTLNTIYHKCYDEWVMPVQLLYIITMLTIFLTGSRTALILGVAYIAFNEITGKWGLLKAALLVVAFIILINTPLFQDTIGKRLQIGFMNESDERYKLLKMFLNNEFGQIRWLSGGGYNYSRYLTSSMKSTTNFEYPILMFAFDYGIISTVCYYIVFGAVPVIKFFREHKLNMLFAYMLLFVFLQICNVTAQFYDFNLVLGFIIVLFSSVDEKNNKVLAK